MRRIHADGDLKPETRDGRARPGNRRRPGAGGPPGVGGASSHSYRPACAASRHGRQRVLLDAGKSARLDIVDPGAPVDREIWRSTAVRHDQRPGRLPSPGSHPGPWNRSQARAGTQHPRNPRADVPVRGHAIPRRRRPAKHVARRTGLLKASASARVPAGPPRAFYGSPGSRALRPVRPWVLLPPENPGPAGSRSRPPAIATGPETTSSRAVSRIATPKLPRLARCAGVCGESTGAGFFQSGMARR